MAELARPSSTPPPARRRRCCARAALGWGPSSRTAAATSGAAVRARTRRSRCCARVGARPLMARALLERARRRDEPGGARARRARSTASSARRAGSSRIDQIDFGVAAVGMQRPERSRVQHLRRADPCRRTVLHPLRAPPCSRAVRMRRAGGARRPLLHAVRDAACRLRLRGRTRLGSRRARLSPSGGWCRCCSRTWSGSRRLSEHRDPEEVRELLRGYFDRCRTLIERYGGTVEKFIGDAVMAVWGTPVAREDDPERAVRAALALTQMVTAAGRGDRGCPSCASAPGVLTGNAAVEVGAEGEGMVLGDTVNTAVAAAVDRRARERCWSTTSPDVPPRPRSRTRTPVAIRSRAASRRCTGLDRAAGRRRRGRRAARRPGSRRRSSGRDRELQTIIAAAERARSSAGPPARDRRRRGGGREVAPAVGILQVPRRRRGGSAGGTRAGASRTARASATGRWPRWSAHGRGSATRTTRRPRGRSSTRRSCGSCPRSASGDWSSHGWPTCSRLDERGRRRSRGPVQRLAAVLRAAVRAAIR